MAATEELAKFITGLKLEDVPPKVIHDSKEHLLDAVACMLAGSLSPVGQIMTRFTREIGGAPESVIVGGGFRTSAPNAAFANGTLCHSLDFDDAGFGGHPSGNIVPALLALGEKLKKTGEEIMEAHAVGFEVYCKLIASHNERASRNRGFHPSAIFGAPAATAAAAKLLRLSVEQICSAFGLVTSQASAATFNAGTMTKPLHPGHAARAGVVAAMLAREGFAARTDAFESPQGFGHIFFGDGDYDPDKLVSNLGAPFSMETTFRSLKKYPCCGGNQRAIDAILYLIQEHRISYEAVDRVIVDLDGRLGDILTYSEPRTGNEGRFSLHYNMAVALLDGKITPASFTDDKAAAPRTQEAIKKVFVNVHQDWETSAGGRRHPVTVFLKNGESYTHAVDKLKGSVDFPLTPEEIMEKYADCARNILTPQEIERSAELILNFEGLPEISELAGILMGREGLDLL